MVNVHIDPSFDDRERRARVYAGDVVVYTHLPEVADFAAFTRDRLGVAFAPHDPTLVHEFRDAERLTEALVEFKPTFIHDPESMNHVRKVMSALGCSLDAVYADWPKLRTAFPTGHLNTGIAYAFQPHRDTWYAAPPQQLNWWMPVWPVAQNNAMEFYPRWFGRSIPNNSDEYDYYTANAWRGRIKDFSGGKDTRVHPAPRPGLDQDEPRLCLLPPIGGIMLFSGDQLHATIENTSGRIRYSIDFRTVDIADVRHGAGAPRADVRCTGTSLRDFHRLSDGESIAEADVARYDSHGPKSSGPKVFVPDLNP